MVTVYRINWKVTMSQQKELDLCEFKASSLIYLESSSQGHTVRVGQGIVRGEREWQWINCPQCLSLSQKLRSSQCSYLYYFLPTRIIFLLQLSVIWMTVRFFKCLRDWGGSSVGRLLASHAQRPAPHKLETTVHIRNLKSWVRISRASSAI